MAETGHSSRGNTPVLILLLALLGFGWGIPARSLAAEPEPGKKSHQAQESEIPTTPSTPPSLIQRTPPNIPHCERYFIYRGQERECDSNLGNDAERLRPIIKDVPAAIAELDAYQENQVKLRIAAYTGSAGLLGIIAGGVMSHPLVDPGTGSLRPGGYITAIGVGLLVNSLIYGLSLKKVNEAHVGNAVRYYNEAHPDDPIDILFNTRVNF